MKQRRISIREVARAAGVSISTVSRVISNSAYPVSEEIRARVTATAERLGYSPNRAAQHLKRTFSTIIGLIARDISDSYFGEIARAVTERGMDRGFLAFVCNTGRNPANELAYHDLLWQYRVRGIILAGGGFDTPEYTEILSRQLQRAQTHGLRIIALAPQGVKMTSVIVDYVQLLERITAELAAHGHRRIALISGPQTVFTTKLHLEGFQRRCADSGLHCDRELILCRDFTEQDGYEGCRQLLSRGRPFTAIIAGSDTIAVGVIHALHESRLAIPADVSVVGIGDLPQARYTRPALTTYRVPRYAMGVRAVDLIAQVEDPLPDEQFFFTPELIERESVGPARP